MTERQAAEPLRINTMGCRWEVDISRLEAPLAQRLRELWAACSDWRPDRSEPDGFPEVLTAYHAGTSDRPNGSVIALQPDVESAPYAFSGAITLRCIERQAGRMTLLHSAALALPDSGATVILIAESGTGKTTAARRLGERLGYLSDETAVIRGDLTLIAHPKPLSIIPEPGRPKIEVAPEEIGLLPAPDQPWLAAAVLLSRSPDVAAPVLEPVDVFEALAEVIPQSSSLPLQEQPLDTLAGVLTAGAGCFRLRYSEIDAAADLVVDVLRSVSRGEQRSRTWQVVTPPQDQRTGPWVASPAEEGELPPGGRVVRAPWRDALADEDGDVFALNGARPVRLMALGASIWRGCAEPRTVEEIRDQIVAEHGPHPDADSLVRQAIATLADEGLVRFVPA